MSVDVEAVTFELYGLRPGEFTAARDAYVARARREKDTAAAAAIGRLRKPTLGVWAANLLVRSRPDQAEALLRLGLELRRAHRELDGGQLRALSHEQHQVIGALVREAGQLAAAAGERLRDAALREIEEILRRVLADEEAARQWASGCMAKAPTGVVGFDGLEPAPGAAPTPAAPAPRRTAPPPLGRPPPPPPPPPRLGRRAAARTLRPAGPPRSTGPNGRPPGSRRRTPRRHCTGGPASRGGRSRTGPRRGRRGRPARRTQRPAATGGCGPAGGPGCEASPPAGRAGADQGPTDGGERCTPA
ncbi:hypothetical protein WKI68_03740 [Streptomyces sp. MS1.HAVA.3]|uniref:Uncharacterized protein n=1 Tax=Streptomyces caledonius TaxID=3134107 RepID=A0ABU8TZH8_9ACTN